MKPPMVRTIIAVAVILTAFTTSIVRASTGHKLVYVTTPLSVTMTAPAPNCAVFFHAGGRSPLVEGGRSALVLAVASITTSKTQAAFFIGESLHVR